MNRQDFYSSVLTYDKQAESLRLRQFVAFIFLFCLWAVSAFFMPKDYGYYTVVLLIGSLFLLMKIVSDIEKRTAKKLGVVCPKCQTLFDDRALRDVAFTNICKQCGSNVYDESNS